VVPHHQVSIHARVRAGDGCRACRHAARPGFNPRPRASGRQAGVGDMQAWLKFQSTPACERATLASWCALRDLLFQSTPACERATRAIRRLPSSLVFQSTPACERATVLFAGAITIVKFQSTPACERATRASARWRSARGRFNPRPRASGRRQPSSQRRGICVVSIHARVRAGDSSRMEPCAGSKGFNPRPRASGRPACGPDHPRPMAFQSTPACERATREPARSFPG